ncbi:hypothetical protein [Leclercia sp. GLN_9]|uniref:hypothetical protein n=1 Tax=Leclercia sp. GLN_9 TaxID=3367184 RepID=UPI00370B6672
MSKPEPRIIAPGYSDEELYIWMDKKLAAIRQLKYEKDLNKELKESIVKSEGRIKDLDLDATLNIDRQ